MYALLNTPDLATELGVSKPTIISWRRNSCGPDFIRVGRLIRYRQSDIDRWLQEQTQHQPTVT